MDELKKPFNGDTFMMEEFLKLQEKFNIECLIETGTHLGNTTKWFSENFKKVYTTEINEDFYAKAKQKNNDAKNIIFLLGDSPDMLKNIFEEISNKKCIFYLDAHWGKNRPTPTPLELKVIKNMNVKPIIVIHDFHVPGKSHPEGLHNTGHPGWGWDYYPDFKYKWDYIENLIIDIYGKDNFEYYYNKEVCGARRGVIYIIPKNN